MFNSMFAPPASVEFASKLIANFTSNALSGEDCLYAACRNTPIYALAFN